MYNHLVRRLDLGLFNWQFLIWSCAFGLVAILFLFYFNRLVAFALFALIRAYTWLSYRIYVRCQAIQVSLLGGRIFLRGLEYHGENETIVVHQVYITWRYWYRRVAAVDLRSGQSDRSRSTEPEDLEKPDHDQEKGPKSPGRAGVSESRDQAPCRISVHIRGIEWFVYNRSPAFDAILASAIGQSIPPADPRPAEQQRDGDNKRNVDGMVPRSQDARESLKSAGSTARPPYQPFIEKPQADIPFVLKILPISVECTKAAMVMGNQHTRSVMVAKIERAFGRITAGSCNIYDKYRQHFDFQFVSPVMRFVPNEDYIEPLLASGARANGLVGDLHKAENPASKKPTPRGTRHLTRHALAKLIPRFQRSVRSFDRRSDSVHRDTSASFSGGQIPGQSGWMGLTRYLDDDEEDILEHEKWQRVEYAEEQVIADCPQITMDFFWDVPGLVPHRQTEEKHAAQECEVNGAVSPEWGLELHIHGGIVNYGPWADRQRLDLMQMFFPSTYSNATPATPLKPGQLRLSTIFKIAIVLEKTVTLRIHTREPSKDWKYKGGHNKGAEGDKFDDKRRQGRAKIKVQSASEPNERPAGWLDVNFEANTAVSYDMDMVARKVGFTNKLRIDVVAPVITSSVNSGLFLKASSLGVTCDLSNPPAWNVKRTWKFDISSHQLELFMLREHAFLIQDLVEDFTSGPSAEFYTFIPFHYDLGLVLDEFKIFLNANDLNIIEKPSDLDDNNFLVLGSRKVVAFVGIPADLFETVKNSITFDGHLSDSTFSVNNPGWNTYNTLLQDRNLGDFPIIIAKGSYNYFSSTSPSLTDTLLMDIHGDQPRLYLYGFLIRMFMAFRENYFGEDIHFQTIEEYQARLQKPGRKHAGDNDHKPTKQSNDLDVILSITTNDPCVLLPSKLYSNTDCVKIDMESGSADLRFTNYYMDLQTTLSPLSLSHVVFERGRSIRDANDLGVQTFVDGISITGHRLFGLPPAEPTYVCNWDFDVGAVTGEASIEYLGALVSGVQTLIYSLDDAENALPMETSSPLNDVTFLRASTKPIRLWLHVDQLALLCEIDSSRVEFNDWTRHRFSERLHVVIPNIILAAVDGQVGGRRRNRAAEPDTPMTFGYMQTAVDVRMVSTKANFRESRLMQQGHLRLQDSRTTRTPWLLSDSNTVTTPQIQSQLLKLQPPASPFPAMPEPMTRPEEAFQLRGDETPASTSTSSIRDRQRVLFGARQRRLEAEQNQTSSVPTATASGDFFSHEQSSSSRSSLSSVSKQAGHFTKPGTKPTNMTFSSSYAQPYFPLLHVIPSDDDVPCVYLFGSPEIATSSDANPDEAPLASDAMEHMTVMIALDTGLRMLCTPPALRAVNTLLGTLQDRAPDSLLDSLQMKSLGDVVAKKKQQHVPKITQLRLHVPGMAIRFRHHVPLQLKRDEKQQTYEIAMNNLLAVARFGADRGEPFGKTPSSMHAALEKLELEARRTTYSNVDEARVLAKLTGLSMWLHEADENTGELKFRTLETASLNQKIAHLAGLVNSAGTLANSLGQAFVTTATLQASRLQSLVYTLSDLGQHVADPPILSSASFVSRRWEEVVRTSDSWKMIMRLRWILNSMNADAALQLGKDLRGNTFNLPADALSRIVSSFQRWRSWDLDYIRASSLMHILYGSATPADQDTTRRRAKPVRFGFSSETISLVIDPGKKRNKILIEGLGAALQSDLHMSSTSADEDVTDHLVRNSVLEVSCERCLLELKLELLDAIGDIVAHVKRIGAAQPIPESKTDLADDVTPVEQQFHVVLGVRRNDVRIRTRYLKMLLETNGFATSIAAKMASKNSVLATALLTARSFSARLRASTKDLIRVAASNPNMYGNLENWAASSGPENKWKIGAQCQRIELDVLEGALGLLGVADQVVGHEVIFLQKFLDRLETVSDHQPVEQTEHLLEEKNSIQVTLHLNSYCITSILFSSLRYRLEGKETRSSLVPESAERGGHVFTFMVSDHAHSVFNDEKGRIQEVCRLPLPPIHGSVRLRQKEQTFLDVTIEMSKIALDASTVHGLFTTLSRTEIMKFGQDLERDIEVVKSNFQTATSGLSSPKTPKTSGSDLAYAAKISLAGVAIVATSSNTLKTSAELVVESGPIYFGIRNSNPETASLIPFPELDLQLYEISVLLESLDANQQRERCGSITLSLSLRGTSEVSDSNQVVRAYHVVIAGLAIDVFTETASMIIDILGYLQQRFKQFNLSEELHTLRARRRRRAKSYIKARDLPSTHNGLEEDIPVALFEAIFTFRLHRLQIVWHVGNAQLRSPVEVPENLVFAVETIDLHTKKGNTARLEIQNLLLQMVPESHDPTDRSKNSALLPEVVFKVAYMSRTQDRRLAVQAVGKALDLRLTSQFILPAVNLQKSIAIATQDLRQVLSDWNETLIQGDSQQKSVLGDKKLASLAIDADFAGAVVHMESKDISSLNQRFQGNRGSRAPREGKYGQFTQANSRSTTTLRSPGLAFRIEYADTPQTGKHLNGELKVAASNNELQPMFVPLVLEVLASVKDVVGDSPDNKPKASPTEAKSAETLPNTENATDPTTILGDCKLNLGLRICQQSFSLTCKPIAQVTATTRFKDIYITISTVQPASQERFFAVSSSITGLEITVQHVYSRESTGRFQVDTINMSLMNSKHVSGMTGISSILNISPMKVFLNVRQLQDFLLFREIWYPVEIRPSPQVPSSRSQSPMKGGVQRYQQATASNAFSWNAAIHIAGLDLSLDLGQAVGKLSFSITRLWITSRKDSEREQNLCLGFDSIDVESSGRMSGSIQLRNMRVRTNIVWPELLNLAQTPLVQASLGFDDLRARISFDYQTFGVADFQSLSFLLYNVTEPGRDRLVCTVNGDKIQAFCTANAAAQGVALYQAINRLIEEKHIAFQASLKEMEKFQRQKDAAGLSLANSQELSRSVIDEPEVELTPVKLQVNVVVSLNALRAGVYPRAFRDAQIFKLEALDALARFGVNVQEGEKVHTLLTVVLGQLRVALSTVERTALRPKALGDKISIDDVVRDSTGSRGGTILKVPRVVATMQTWQAQASKQVEYIFKSTFEGKVEVGWNYSRISFIRGMWDTHSKTLVQRLGKLPPSAVQITSSPRPDSEKTSNSDEAQEKITAVVNVPVSKYVYEAREPPVIQTPQLRDMGEATPPLEWIGLQREKLPNLTHQVVIVPLLEFSKEVEDAYGKILGSS